MPLSRLRIPIAALAISLAGMLASAGASAASLDSGFGQDGTVITNTGNPPYEPFLTKDYTGNVWALAEDNRGRILAGGGTGSKSLVIRYLPDGSLDPSFGAGGKVMFGSVDYPDQPEKTSNRIRAISLLPDGKILLAGEEKLINRSSLFPPDRYYIRLMSNGSHDPSFAVFPNYFDGPPPLVVLYGGIGYFDDVAVQPDGKILTVGKEVNSFNSKNRDLAYISRRGPELSHNGTVLPFDRGFARGPDRRGSGVRNVVPAKWPFKNAFRQIKLLGSGKILVGGNLRNRFFVGRLTRHGNWDRSFGKTKNGKVVSEIKNTKGKNCLCSVGSGMATDRKGRIVLTGWSFPDGTQQTLNLLRYSPNGHPDKSFGKGGKVRLKLNQYVTVRRVVVHPNGTVFVAAWLGYRSQQKFAVFAFKTSGKPLRSFFNKGRYIRAIGETSTAEDVLIDRKGRLVVSGGTFKDGDASFVIKRFRVGG